MKYNVFMDIATIKKLPKYIYTPDKTRAFLTFAADVYGRWNAGYIVYGVPIPEGQASYFFGPTVDSCDDISMAAIQLLNAYEVWKEDQGGLRSGRG